MNLLMVVYGYEKGEDRRRSRKMMGEEVTERKKKAITRGGWSFGGNIRGGKSINDGGDGDPRKKVHHNKDNGDS